MVTTNIIVGIDEVGRGPWAGPVVSAAVVLGENIPGLKDSKKLSYKQRINLDKLIRQSASYFAIGEVSNIEIDKLGLTKAVGLSMKRAISQIDAKRYQTIVIDGNFNYLPEYSNVQIKIKADDTILAVMAASIIAKVYRDNLLINYAQEFPNYAFEKNFGYGTRQHRLAIEKYGLTDIHRRSFRPIHDYLISKKID